MIKGRRPAVFHGEFYFADSDQADELQLVGLGAQADWSDARQGTQVSASKFGACVKLKLANGSVVYCKTETYSLKHRIKYWLRPTRAGVEAFAYRELERLGIPTLKILSFGERRRFGLPLQTMIVTQELEQSRDLRDFATKVWREMELPERRAVFHELAMTLARQLSKAHASGFVHHDLKWRNVLVQRSGEKYRTVWIDAPRAAYWRFRRRRGRVIDLSDLGGLAVEVLSVYDCMRFVRWYLGSQRAKGQAAEACRAVGKRLGRRGSRAKELG